MSFWLNNVNNLLTKLDDQVETVVEERVFAQNDLSCEGIDVARTGINDILAKRGLSSMDREDEMDDKEEDPKSKKDTAYEDEDNEDDKRCLLYEKKAEGTKTINGTVIDYTNGVDTNNAAFQSDNHARINTAQQDLKQEERLKSIEKSPTSTGEQLPTQEDSEAISSKAHFAGEPKISDLKKKNTRTVEATPQEIKVIDEKIEQNLIEMNENSASLNLSMLSKSKDEPLMPSSPPSSKMFTLTTSEEPTAVASSLQPVDKGQKHQLNTLPYSDRSKKEIRELVSDRKEAQKEARTLRRHIISLNDQLETAESELQAQRKELERAAEQMNKDRSRHGKEKETLQKLNVKEITLLKTQNEKNVKEQQARFEEQLERYRIKLSDEEKHRKQQGGNWDKEMSNAIDREHDMRQKLILLEDEKAVFLSQISTLQGQQTALGSRLESLSQATDNAMQRERDAENRLDVALNQHARQIGHRQARESQLERTIQDLNAALVVSHSNTRVPGNNGTVCEGGSDDPLRGSSHLEARIDALALDLRTANSHLAIEKERSETLQNQLRSFSNETTHEATIVHAKEIQYDRQIADMSLTISKLEAKIRQYEKVSPNTSKTPAGSLDDEKLPNHIQVLSEEVVRLRDKIANQNSESLAMKNRLKAAIDSSTKLEEELQTAKISSNSDEVIYDSTARGRNNNTSGGRRRNFGAPSSGSIRTAMLLNSSTSDRTEQIGEVVDQIDSFAASTGRYLKRNPLARAGFIFYLILIHLWTFVLLFFHAHSFDTIPKSVAGVGYPHGPHSIMQHQQITENADLH